MTLPAKVILPRAKSSRRPASVKAPRLIWKPPWATGADRSPVIVRSPPSSASMPCPRTKIRDGALTAMLRSALKAGAALALATLFLAASASRARAAAEGFICRVSASGRLEAGMLSGTRTSMLSNVTLPPMRGRRASGPLMSSASSAMAVMKSLETSSALCPVTRSVAGNPASGATRTLPLAESEPPLRVAAVKRSIVTSSPRPRSSAEIALKRMPASGSSKTPSAKLAVPEICGFCTGPCARASSVSFPATLRPLSASATLARAASSEARSVTSIAPAEESGSEPSIWAEPLRGKLSAALMLVRSPCNLPEALNPSAATPAARSWGAENFASSRRQSPVGAEGLPPIRAEASSAPSRARSGLASLAKDSGRPLAFKVRSSVSPALPSTFSLPAPDASDRPRISTPPSGKLKRAGAAKAMRCPAPLASKAARSTRSGLLANKRPLLSIWTPRASADSVKSLASPADLAAKRRRGMVSPPKAARSSAAVPSSLARQAGRCLSCRCRGVRRWPCRRAGRSP